MGRTAIKSAWLLPMDETSRVIEQGTVEYDTQSGRIEWIGETKAYLPKAGVTVLDASDCIVMPGLVNGHAHSAMTLLRGYAEDLPLEEWLFQRIFPAEKKWVSPEMVRAGSELAALEMIRSGTTLVNDMYYFQEETAAVLAAAGMRSVSGFTVIQRTDELAKNDRWQEDYLAFREKLARYPMVVSALAPHAIYTVSVARMEEIVALAETTKSPIHIHLSETEQENVDCQKKYGKSPTELLDAIGVFSQRPILAHGTCLSEKDITILGKRRASVIYNPESNLKLGTKICPVVALRAAGAVVGLGTDSAASNNNLDLFQEIDTGTKLQKYQSGPVGLKAVDAVRLMTIEGARALGLGSVTGSLELGKSADFIAVSIARPHATPLYSPYSHLIYSATGADVKHSVVAGRTLMENFVVKSLDESRILKDAIGWGRKIAGA